MIDFNRVTEAELWDRFQEFDFRNNPLEAPLARALLAYGFNVTEYPLLPEFTTTDWLASSVNINGLTICFRQPTVNEVLVCRIQRAGRSNSLRTALFGIIHFFQFCHDECPDIQVGGACITRWDFIHAPTLGELDFNSLAKFYRYYIGDVRMYDKLDSLWFFGDIRAQLRYETIPIWKHCKRVGLPRN